MVEYIVYEKIKYCSNWIFKQNAITDRRRPDAEWARAKVALSVYADRGKWHDFCLFKFRYNLHLLKRFKKIVL